MEQYFFENRCILEESVVEELLRARNAKPKIRILKWIGITMGVLFLFFHTIMPLCAGATITDVDWFSSVWVTALLVYILFNVKIGVKVFMYRNKRRCGGEIPELIYRFGDRIETVRHIGNNSIDYTDIRDVYCLEHYFVILFNNRRMAVLSYDGFVKGDFEEFREFLQTKRPDMLIP